MQREIIKPVLPDTAAGNQATYRQFAAEALCDFPALRGRFAVLDTQTGECTGDLNTALEGFFKSRGVKKWLKDNAGPPPRGFATSLRTRDVDLIKIEGAVSFSGEPEPDLMFTLDHELGHLVVAGGHSPDVNKAEVAADIFALLRHIQRYGDDGYADMVMRRRATGVLFKNDSNHFTNVALAALEGVKDRVDIKSLSPRATADLAATMAERWAMPVQAQASLTRVFDTASARRRPEAYLYEVIKSWAEVLCRDIPAQDFKTGLAVLAPFTVDHLPPPVPGTADPLYGAEWKGICERLKAKEAGAAVQPLPEKRAHPLFAP